MTTVIQRLESEAKCSACIREPSYLERVQGPDGLVLVPWCWQHGVDRALEPDSRMGPAICHDGKAYPDAGRASGQAVCQCGKEYRDHPMFGLLGYRDQPFLNQLCDGTVVKL